MLEATLYSKNPENYGRQAIEDAAKKLVPERFPETSDLSPRQLLSWMRGKEGLIPSTRKVKVFGLPAQRFAERNGLLVRMCMELEIPSPDRVARFLTEANYWQYGNPRTQKELQLGLDLHRTRLGLPKMPVMLVKDPYQGGLWSGLSPRLYDETIWDAEHSSWETARQKGILPGWATAQTLTDILVPMKRVSIYNPSDAQKAAAWIVASSESGRINDYPRGNPFLPLAGMHRGGVLPIGPAGLDTKFVVELPPAKMLKPIALVEPAPNLSPVEKTKPTTEWKNSPEANRLRLKTMFITRNRPGHEPIPLKYYLEHVLEVSPELPTMMVLNSFGIQLFRDSPLAWGLGTIATGTVIAVASSDVRLMYRLEEAIKRHGYDSRIMAHTLDKNQGNNNRAIGQSVADKYGFGDQYRQQIRNYDEKAKTSTA